MNKEKIAAVDIGTNSFHLIVVELTEEGNFSIVDREKEVIRLSEGSKGDIKGIKPVAERRAIETLKRFKNIADSHEAPLRAVATSAVRESLNRKEFIENIFNETSVKIEVISGYEEARLIYLGILKAVPCYNYKTLCIDIGGGSTEFLLGYKGEKLFANSLKLGAVRLTERFFPNYVVNKENIEACKNWVKGELIPIKRELDKHGFEIIVGSSGTIQAAANMISHFHTTNSTKLQILNNFEFNIEQLKNVSKVVLNSKSVTERSAIKGLDSKRADIIPAGIVLLSTIHEVLGIENMTVSGYALREGIVIDSIQKMELAENPKLHNIRFNSVEQLANSCRFDKTHCDYVADISIELFKQLKSIHKLDDFCLEYLEAAAKLHDIGFHISHSQHHRHSQYLIKNSELLGFNNSEINIISNIARYHRKSHPKAKHTDYSQLSNDHQNIVRKLSSLLRIADALDRGHNQIFSNVSCTTENGFIKIEADYTGEYPEVELWSLTRKKELFLELFEKNIIVELTNIDRG